MIRDKDSILEGFFFFRMFTILLYLWQSVMRFFSLSKFFDANTKSCRHYMVCCETFYGYVLNWFIFIGGDRNNLLTTQTKQSPMLLRFHKPFFARCKNVWSFFVNLRVCSLFFSPLFAFLHCFHLKWQKNHCIFSFNEHWSKIRTPLWFS